MYRLDTETRDAGGTMTVEAPPPPASESRSTPIGDELATDLRALEAFIGRILAVAEESAGDGSYVAARRRILRDLERFGPQTAESLPRTWPVTVEHVARLLEELEEDGLVQRVRSDPLRFRLTDSGLVALRGTQHVQAGLISRLLVSVAMEETEDAVEIFRTLRAALGR